MFANYQCQSVCSTWASASSISCCLFWASAPCGCQSRPSGRGLLATHYLGVNIDRCQRWASALCDCRRGRLAFRILQFQHQLLSVLGVCPLWLSVAAFWPRPSGHSLSRIQHRPLSAVGVRPLRLSSRPSGRSQLAIPASVAVGSGRLPLAAVSRGLLAAALWPLTISDSTSTAFGSGRLPIAAVSRGRLAIQILPLQRQSLSAVGVCPLRPSVVAIWLLNKIQFQGHLLSAAFIQHHSTSPAVSGGRLTLGRLTLPAASRRVFPLRFKACFMICVYIFIYVFICCILEGAPL